jgi:hypothetical protein
MDWFPIDPWEMMEMRLVLRGWTGAAVLIGLLTGWGCGGGGPAPGMGELPPPGALPPGFEAKKEMKKDPVKFQQMVDAIKKKAQASGGR